MKIVWVPVRHANGRLIYHESPECGLAKVCVPTAIEFAEKAALERCAFCQRGGSVAERRRVVTKLREEGYTLQAIATRIASRWDVSKQVVHKDYQRAVKEREASA